MNFKRILSFILTFVVLGSILPAAAETTGESGIAITEVCFNPTYKKNSFELDESTDMFEYIEIENYSEKDISLDGYSVKCQLGGKTYENKIIPNPANPSMTLKSGEAAVLVIVQKYAATAGLGYAADEEYTKLYKEFCKITNPKKGLSQENFFLIPKSVSGSEETIPGTFNLPNDGNTELTVCSSDGSVMAKCSYNADNYNNNSRALHFMYAGNNVSEPLCLGAVTPGSVYSSQIPSLSATPLVPSEGEKVYPLKFMEYNICATPQKTIYNDAGDEVTPETLAEGVIETIGRNDPDVLCLCEVNYFWEPFINKYLDGKDGKYSSFGTCSDGQVWGKDELPDRTWNLFNLVLWKKDKYICLDKGYFWCSSEPGHAGYFSWYDGTVGDFCRAVNWVILEDRKTGGQFFVLCTHLDAKVTQSRYNSAQLVLEKVKELSSGLPVMITGDWNCSEGSTSYAALTEDDFLYDSRYRTASPETMKIYGSTTGFKAGSGYTKKLPIDACFISSHDIYVDKIYTDLGTFAAEPGMTGSDHMATVYEYRLAVVNKVPHDRTVLYVSLISAAAVIAAAAVLLIINREKGKKEVKKV